MSEYSDLTRQLIDNPNVEYVLELNIAESSLRRGIKAALKEINEVQSIMDLKTFDGTVVIVRDKSKEDTYRVKYSEQDKAPAVKFTIVGTAVGNTKEDF